MLDKSMRIVVADKNAAQRYAIEKMLNALGYFRVALASSAEEALKLTQVTTCPVSLLVIEEGLHWCSCVKNSPADQPWQPPACVVRYRSHARSVSFLSWESFFTGMPDMYLLSNVLSACSPIHRSPEPVEPEN